MYIVNNSDMQAIADAIRSKTGKIDKMYPREMADEINSITGLYSKEQYLGGVDVLSIDTITKFTDSFYGDDILTTIDLPNVTDISNTTAFAHCSSLTSVNVPKLEKFTSQFNFCDKLDKLKLPGITYVGAQTSGSTKFYPKGPLKVLDFGTGATAVSSTFTTYGYFYYLYNLKTLILRCPTGFDLGISSTDSAAKNNRIFSPTSPISNGTGFIYVPSTLVNTYKTLYPFSLYADQIRAIEDYPDICE